MLAFSVKFEKLKAKYLHCRKIWWYNNKLNTNIIYWKKGINYRKIGTKETDATTI